MSTPPASCTPYALEVLVGALSGLRSSVYLRLPPSPSTAKESCLLQIRARKRVDQSWRDEGCLGVRSVIDIFAFVIHLAGVRKRAEITGGGGSNRVQYGVLQGDTLPQLHEGTGTWLPMRSHACCDVS